MNRLTVGQGSIEDGTYVFPEISEPEHYEPKFRGIFVPAEIFHLLTDRIITPTEFALLTIIDSLVDAKGIGCYASNKYLGDRVGVSKVQINKLVRNLRKLGLVKVVGNKKVHGRNHRILETKWSRVYICPVSVDDDGT